MNKQEFCDRTGIIYEDLGEDDWEIIQTVYNFHPLITDTKGKDEIAMLYNTGGMGLMHDMHGTAFEISCREDASQKARICKDQIEKDFKEKLDELNKWYAEHISKQNAIIDNNHKIIYQLTERYRYK